MSFGTDTIIIIIVIVIVVIVVVVVVVVVLMRSNLHDVADPLPCEVWSVLRLQVSII